MFETAALGRRLSRDEFDASLDALRAPLLKAQFALQKSDVPVIIIIEGVDGAGKGGVLNFLTKLLDVRGVEVHTDRDPTDEARERPPQWRHWVTMPRRGRIGIYLGGWYERLIRRHVLGKIDQARFERELLSVVRLERMLAVDHALILKFWLHITKEQQARRYKKWDAKKATKWRVSKGDRKLHSRYDELVAAAERAIRITDLGLARWQLIEAWDRRYRDLAVTQAVFQAMKMAAEQATERAESDHGNGSTDAVLNPPPGDQITILDRVDLSQSVDDETYEKRLERLQEEIGRLAAEAYEAKRSTVVVLEGWDAAGKGGTIRRLVAALDARLFQVISVGAPTDEERAQHYLWRFWRRVPRGGRFTIYDRSWYGRVLVERVEGFATTAEWKRAYREINEFEEQLSIANVKVLKFWLHIDADEQLRRFEERQQIDYKRHKITEEDWRNRDKWVLYEEAVNEMIARTSTATAPWVIVPANSKRYARIHVLQTIRDSLAQS